MNFIRYNTPLNHTISELADWFRDPSSDLDPFARFAGLGKPLPRSRGRR